MKKQKKFVALVSCLILIFTALTGCSSILQSNGKISTTAETVKGVNVTPTPYMDAQETEDLSDEDLKKYGIDGTNAFYILPEHKPAPDNIVNFKLLDLIDGTTTIYAYQAYYNGTDEDGLTSEKTGTAAADYKNYAGGSVIDPKTVTKTVTVIMSYNTQTRQYNVFNSVVCAYGGAVVADANSNSGDSSAAELQNKIDNQVEKPTTIEFTTLFNFDNVDYTIKTPGGSKSSATQSSGTVASTAQTNSGNELDMFYAQKVINGSSLTYLLYINGIAYVFDSKGQQIQKKNIILQINKINEKYGTDNTISLSNIVMDKNFYLYLIFDIEKKGVVDDSTEESDIDDSNSSVCQIVLKIFMLTVGDDGKTYFVSNNANYDDQIKDWQETATLDLGTYDSEPTDDVCKNAINNDASSSPDKVRQKAGKGDSFGVYTLNNVEFPIALNYTIVRKKTTPYLYTNKITYSSVRMQKDRVYIDGVIDSLEVNSNYVSSVTNGNTTTTDIYIPLLPSNEQSSQKMIESFKAALPGLYDKNSSTYGGKAEDAVQLYGTVADLNVSVEIDPETIPSGTQEVETHQFTKTYICNYYVKTGQKNQDGTDATTPGSKTFTIDGTFNKCNKITFAKDTTFSINLSLLSAKMLAASTGTEAFKYGNIQEEKDGTNTNYLVADWQISVPGETGSNAIRDLSIKISGVGSAYGATLVKCGSEYYHYIYTTKGIFFCNDSAKNDESIEKYFVPNTFISKADAMDIANEDDKFAVEDNIEMTTNSADSSAAAEDVDQENASAEMYGDNSVLMYSYSNGLKALYLAGPSNGLLRMYLDGSGVRDFAKISKSSFYAIFNKTKSDGSTDYNSMYAVGFKKSDEITEDYAYTSSDISCAKLYTVNNIISMAQVVTPTPKPTVTPFLQDGNIVVTLVSPTVTPAASPTP